MSTQGNYDLPPLTCETCGSAVEAAAPGCGTCGEPRPGGGWKSLHEVETALFRIELPADRAPLDDTSEEVPEPGFDAENVQPLQVRVPVDDEADEVVADEHTLSRPLDGLRPDTALVPGQVFARRYRVQELTHELGTARWYLAVQEPMVRRAFLLTLRSGLAEDPTHLEERFMEDAQRLAAVRAPQLARIHDFGRAADGTCYSVVELVYGLTLREILHWGPLSLERVFTVFEDVARGLAACHEAQVVHRAVRAENVVLQPIPGGGEAARLTGYGLDVTPETFEDTTDANVARYTAPELAQGEEADVTSDIYSFGILLYRALTGRMPFDYLDVDDILDAQASEAVPEFPLEDLDVVIPPALEAITRRCLEKGREQRYASASLLLDDIVAARKALYPRGVGAPPLPAAAPVPAPGPEPVRWVVVAAASFTGAFLSASLVLAVLLLVVLPRVESARGAAPPPAAAPADAEQRAPEPVVEAVAAAVVPVEVPAADEQPAEAAQAAVPERSAPVARSGRGRGDTSSQKTWAPAPEPVPEPAPEVPMDDVAAIDVPAAAAATGGAPAPEAPVVAAPVQWTSHPVNGRWVGKVAGDDVELDLDVYEDGTVAGSAVIFVDHYELQGDVRGRVQDPSAGSAIELHVTIDRGTNTYTGLVEDGQLRGKVLVGGRPEGKFTLRHP